jgi:hypothetical protein
VNESIFGSWGDMLEIGIDVRLGYGALASEFLANIQIRITTGRSPITSSTFRTREGCSAWRYADDGIAFSRLFLKS